MKIYRVKYTNQVLQQIEDMVSYILDELQSVYAANDLLNTLETAMQSLRELPKRHQLVNDEPWQTEGVRKFVVKNCNVYYWTDDVNGEVWVIAVVSGTQNQENVLKRVYIDNGKVHYTGPYVVETSAEYNKGR